jgi:hypothetical protein
MLAPAIPEEEARTRAVKKHVPIPQNVSGRSFLEGRCSTWTTTSVPELTLHVNEARCSSGTRSRQMRFASTRFSLHSVKTAKRHPMLGCGTRFSERTFDATHVEIPVALAIVVSDTPGGAEGGEKGQVAVISRQFLVTLQRVMKASPRGCALCRARRSVDSCRLLRGTRGLPIDQRGSNHGPSGETAPRSCLR